MKNFGYAMKKNINSKKIIDDYVKQMNEVYEEQIEYQQLYLNDKLNDEYFDYYKSLKFTRTWEILNEMEDIPARNIMLLFNACGDRYKETLEALCGLGVTYKNQATLHVIITKTRKKIKDLYNDKYGTD